MTDNQPNEKSLANLQPVLLHNRPDFKEISRKGGLAKSRAKDIANMANKKCRNCRLPCPLKDQGVKDNSKCLVPAAQKMILEAAESPQKLLDSVIMDVFHLSTVADGFDEKEKAAKLKLQLKGELFPVPRGPVVQVNVQQNFLDEGRKEHLLKLLQGDKA